MFVSHYKSGRCFLQHWILQCSAETSVYSKAMDTSSIHKDEKNDAVQLCQDPSMAPPKRDDMTGSPRNENLRSEITPRDSQVADEPYSIYSHRTKTFLIISVSFMAIISPLSAAVYLPAIPQIGHDLGVSPSLINLTITTYMVSFSTFHYTIPV